MSMGKKQNQHKQQVHVQMASFNLCISQTIQEPMRQMYRNFAILLFFFSHYCFTVKCIGWICPV